VAFLLGLLLNVYNLFPDCRADEQAQLKSRSKITFDLEQLNENGLYGPPGGLRALHYEFCIPGSREGDGVSWLGRNAGRKSVVVRNGSSG
jgi:hypothetical protein